MRNPIVLMMVMGLSMIYVIVPFMNIEQMPTMLTNVQHIMKSITSISFL
ncbi:hypothetical protein ACFOLK_13335 [Marinococcus halophilus]|uniref:Uncharacterized protein n=1 Tax=Marinococcus halophilus TaxID=1371 RepID=A0A510YA79_MARHA|nr:hypothetical protein [Marinococcus halophilus]GEK59601.1 hypothetical protein MHA01_25060 [Marinococcus halophilus]